MSEDVVVLGSQGQLGRALINALGARGVRAIGLSREQADLSLTGSLAEKVQSFNPSVVINAAAYTAVDLAEKENHLAFTVNAEAPGVLARFCADQGIPFVHFSTDYVFSGEGTQPYKEDDAVAPLSVYGKSKLAGEEEVMNSGAEHLIFRTSWVYSLTGKNFLNTMLRLAREQKELRIVTDQIGAPTYAAELAQIALKALTLADKSEVFPSGIYHACHSGETSWKGFAEEIFERARARGETLAVEQVVPLLTAEYPTAAQRPLNSRLDTQKLFNTFKIRFSSWQQGLKYCLESQK